MKDYKGLLKKFWAGEATEPEKLQLYKLVIEQEELSSDQEINHTEETVLLDPEESKRILAALHQEIEGVPTRPVVHLRTKLVRIFRSAAAIAAVLITVLVVVKWNLHSSIKSPNETTAVTQTKTISNTLAHILTIKLEDSSLVTIYPGSSISYPDSFTTGRERVVQLKGKADFKVQHNANSPFQVIALQIKTTDIGTEFNIDALQSDVVKVKLKEGSIRVEALPGCNIAMNRKMQKPGEELNINLVTREITAVEPFRNVIPQENPIHAGKHVTLAKTRLNFNKTPLTEVFARLSQREQVKIKFDKTDLDGLSFTGSIEPKDPLELSLNVLCGLNGLSYTKTEQGIAITKNK